jgi:hypothetical protein
MIYNDQSKMKNIAGPWQLLQQENASFSWCRLLICESRKMVESMISVCIRVIDGERDFICTTCTKNPPIFRLVKRAICLCLLPASCCFLASFSLQLWRWRYILRNVGWLWTDYTTSYPGRQNLSSRSIHKIDHLG